MSTPNVSSSSSNPSHPSRLSLWQALLLQWGVMILAAAALVGVKALAGSLGQDNIQSIGLALAIVGVAGTVALVIASLAGTPQQAANFVLAGMAVRLFVPLAAMLMVSKRWPELVEAGFRDQLVILYLVALVVETYAAIRVTGMPRPRFASNK